MRRVKPAKDLESAKFLLLKRRILKYLPRHPARFFGSLLVLLATGIALLGLADSFDHGSRLRRLMLATTGELGLTVQDVEVEGRSMTAPREVLQALGVRRGMPILAVAPEKARQELEELPWVRSATVERRLPATVFVRLDERKPLAIWQRNGRMMLIDTEGVVVTTEHLERYPNLLLVVGEGAPAHAQALIDALRQQPGLMKRVAAAVRVDDRRWNLDLDNGITVELPETGYADAVDRLAGIDREHGLFARDIVKIDLRLADRVVVTPTAPAEPAKSDKRIKRAAGKP